MPPLADHPIDPHSLEALPAPVTPEEKAQDSLADKEEKLRQKILAKSVNEARARFDPRTDFEGFVKEVSKRFIENKLDAFPTICEIARMQNLIKRQELEKTGNRGRFTGKAGFSQDGNSFFKYEIPRELYLFMVNLVYWDFWGHENAKVADLFMRKVIRGDDAMQTLMWVKTIYGPNNQQGLTA